jgi:hypothetical protein
LSKKFLTSLNLLGKATDPATGIAGDLYYNTALQTVKVYTGTEWTVISGGGGGSASITVADTTPADPSEGSMWFESDTGKFFVYYDSFWVELGAPGSQGPQGVTGSTGPAGPGVPVGGTANQALVKINSTDYNTQWSSIALSSANNTFTGVNTFNNDVVIAESGTGTALQITNSGTGNSFLVEDTISPDGSPFVIDPAGNVGIGTVTPATKLNVNGAVQFGTSATATNNWHLTTEAGDGELRFWNGNYGSGSLRLRVSANGIVTFTNNITVTGSVTATSKSFEIDHPTKEGMRLRYGSLEGPENGVYVRGRTKVNTINLPDYWTGLVDESTITVNLTPVGKSQSVYVESIKDNAVVIGGELDEVFFTIYAERKDIDKLTVEF